MERFQMGWGPMISEGAFQTKVINFLNEHEIWHVKYWAGSKFTKEGIPDILACIDGVFHGIELKTDIGKESKLQAYNMDGINANNGEGYILSPTKHIKHKYPEYNYYALTFNEWKERFF